ncbi:MAG: protoporphyrinogen oxidase [Actinomycetota bacterium]|nr:protoporphyrinogen oxidase [Actinomycetota bacterium]
MATRNSHTDVAIVGAGITGLSAARAIKQSRPKTSVVVLEAADRVGGKIATIDADGVTIETGADSFLARDRVAVDLCDEIGLSDQLLAPEVFGAVIFAGGRLQRLPDGFVYGIPASLSALARARVLTPWGRARASVDLLLPGRATDDEPVGSFVRRRFGRELLDKVVDPLLAGTRAGHIGQMSLAASLPQIFEVARSSRSVIRGLRRATAAGSVDGGRPPFLTIAGGLSRLPESIAGSLDIRLNTRVTSIERGSRYSVVTNNDTLEAQHVIVTTPAFVSAKLVASASERASAALSTMTYASVASVALIYDDLTFVPPPGTSGLLVPSSEQQAIAGCTWYSTKWPHTSPQGVSVLRCFVGRAGTHDLLHKDDGDIAAAVVNDLERLLHVGSTPRDVLITRWPDGLPQYAVGHLDAVSSVENALAKDAPGVLVAGAGFRGSGIPDCIRQGRRAAQIATAALGRDA